MLSCSGTQDVSVAALWLLLILYVRSHGTQESVIEQPLCDFSVSTSSHRSLRSLHPLPRQPPWKQAFSGCHCNVWPLWGMPWGYINEKNTAFRLCFLVAGPRIELGTSWLWIMRSNQLSYPAIIVKNLVEIEGLEPSLTEPESVVLPLHHISIWLPIFILGLQRYKCFMKLQNFLWKIAKNA